MSEQSTPLIWTTEKVVAVIRDLATQEDLPFRLIVAPISGHDTVDSLGIDSLGGVYLIERLEQLTGHLMPDDFLDLDFTISEIAERLNRLGENKRQT